MLLKYSICVTLFVVAVSVGSSAQSDWHTYPVRSMAEIVRAHEGDAANKAELIVSADPFPSKTDVTYTGKRRPVNEYTKFFIGVWAETRNLPAQNTAMLAEEYLFKANDREYWMPVDKRLVPYFEKDLKEGDTITIYYFFIGGYHEKRLREKKADQTKENLAVARTLEDKVDWVFVVEEFRKPASNAAGESEYISQPLTAAVDNSLAGSGKVPDFFVDPRQVKSKSSVIYTGDVRSVGEKKIRLLQLWVASRELPPKVIELLRQEVRFREGDNDYWLPVRSKILEDLKAQMKKGDALVIHTILAGGLSQGDSIDWVFVVGDYSK